MTEETEGAEEPIVELEPLPSPASSETELVPLGPAPEEPPATDVLARQVELVQEEVSAGFERVLAAFESRLANDSFREKQLDRLHEELDGHRKDLLLRAVRPLLHGVIKLHADVSKRLEIFRDKPAGTYSADDLAEWYGDVCEDIETFLAQHGVHAFRSEPDRLDPRRQAAMLRKPTSDAALVGTVARQIRPGFEQGEAVLEKERVEVFVAEAPTGPEAVQEPVVNEPEQDSKEEN